MFLRRKFYRNEWEWLADLVDVVVVAVVALFSLEVRVDVAHSRCELRGCFASPSRHC